MTFAAFRTVLSFMNVIGEMTVDTPVAGAGKILRRVTAVAAGNQVRANQVKCCDSVVEVRVLPATRNMAGTAFNIQCLSVHIIGTVTARAI